VPRNYTQATIKTLFGEARTCAFPGCNEPLIFRDRGKATAIAEIAHIRSETRGGPRHDPNYTGDVNGPENLLLLCGKHHRPVDRHESVYSIEELDTWKAAQRAAAGGGTSLSDSDLRSYQRLSDEERQSIRDIARLAQRVTSLCKAGHPEIANVRAQAEHSRQSRGAQRGFAYAVDEDGNETPLHQNVQLSPMEQAQWQAEERTTWEPRRHDVEAALVDLDGEIAVLRMFTPTLGEAGERVAHAAAQVVAQVGDAPRLDAAARQLDTTVGELWRAATGDVVD
jgi:hypothetical protein